MKRLLSIVVSIGLLFLLYRAVDFQGTLNLLKNYNPYSLSLSLLLSIPIFFFHCLRLNILCRPFFKLKNALSFKLISLALSLNLILPAKLGDIGKAYFLSQEKTVSRSKSFSIVLMEKINDLIGLVGVCLIGLVFIRHDIHYFKLAFIPLFLFLLSAVSLLFSKTLFSYFRILLPKKINSKLEPFFSTFRHLQHYNQTHLKESLLAITLSFFVSLAHLLQLWYLFQSITEISFTLIIGLTPLAILAAFLPLSISGVGVRDLSFVGLYTPFTGPESAVGFGLLATLRVVWLAIPGSLFITKGTLKKVKNLI